jgi:uncharacterized membrane protein YfbV (UPF0208 family)
MAYGTCPMFGGSYGASVGILATVTYIVAIALMLAGIYWLVKNANKRK